MSSFDAWRAARLASAILLISGAAAGRDDAVDEILRRSQQTVNHAAAIAGEDAADIRRNHPEAITDDGAWLSGRPVDLNEDRVGEAATAQQRAWNEAMGQAAAAAAAVGRGPPQPAVPDNVVFVFISLSMPDEAIRALFQEALRESDLPPPISEAYPGGLGARVHCQEAGILQVERQVAGGLKPLLWALLQAAPDDGFECGCHLLAAGH